MEILEMVSKISGINNLVKPKINETVTAQKAEETKSQSIFNQETEEAKETKKHSHGKGLGVGQIPPGIQKKIDSGNVPQSLIDKFKQIAEALKAKEAPVETVPATEVVPAQEFVPDAALAQQVAAEIALAQELLG